jgi:hypothetical protein
LQNLYSIDKQVKQLQAATQPTTPGGSGSAVGDKALYGLQTTTTTPGFQANYESVTPPIIPQAILGTIMATQPSNKPAEGLVTEITFDFRNAVLTGTQDENEEMMRNIVRTEISTQLSRGTHLGNTRG